MKKTVLGFISFASMLLVACGGGGGGGSSGGGVVTIPTTINLTSTAFVNNAAIPTLYQCSGKSGGNELPALTWTNLPANTRSLVFIMDDPDSVGSTFTHFVNIMKTQAEINNWSGSITAAASTNPMVWSGGSMVGLSDMPPCNPTLTQHHYTWSIYAMNAEYSALASVKNLFDPIITSEVTTPNSLNLNTIVGSSTTPKFTRATFERDFSSVILAKGTLVGLM